MSFYDDASLVVIPSGYKTSKVYAEKPTDGSGDLAFTRTGDTATRVNSAGLIEKVRTNLVLQSQTFDNASWAKTTVGGTVTVTANYGTAPDGTTTADRIQLSAPSAGTYADVLQVISLTSGRPTTYSVYLKALTGTPTIIFYNDGVTGNKTITLTSEWVRYTFSVQSSGIVAYPRFLCENGATSSSADILAWGAQLETGDVATDYIPTTGAAVSVGPVANVPRLDYLGSTCPRLLLEPQRTNSITSSENISTGWTYTNTAISVNQTVSPDGYANADAIVPDATSGQHAINSNNITASGAFTLSAFVKAGEYTKVAIRESANTGSYASFNLATGTKIEDNVSGAAFIQSYGNGWYRIGVTGTFSGTIRLGINVLSNAYTTGNPSSGTTFFSGNASDKLFCWGMQTELGATYATSYIPTITSATRGADACSKTGISSLIGQTEGTLFVDAILTHDTVSNEYLIQVRANNSNRFFIYREGSTNKLACFALVGAATIYNQLTASAVTGTFKAAFAYKSGSFAFYVNGVQVGTSSATYTLASTLSEFFIDQNNGLEFAYHTYKQAILFPTRLTNAQLSELTTL